MDDESKELVHAATQAGVETFLKTIAAPLVEAGGWGGDLIRRYRFESQVKTLVRAQQMLSEAGLAAHAVSLKLLVPLLEHASLEDDPDEAAEPQSAAAMQERWAALLANAAAAGAGTRVSPAFPRLLAELEPVDAAILEGIAPEPASLASIAAAAGFASDAPLKMDRFLVHLENLERLNLCIVERPSRDVIDLAEAVRGLDEDRDRAPGGGLALVRGRPLSWGRMWRTPTPSRAPRVRLSALGAAFLEACKPPTGGHAGGSDARPHG